MRVFMILAAALLALGLLLAFGSGLIAAISHAIGLGGGVVTLILFVVFLYIFAKVKG